MAVPAIAAAAAKKAALEVAKDPAGAAKKGAKLGCSALVVIIAVPLFIFCMILNMFVPIIKIFVGTSAPVQAASTANLVTPMPTLAAGLANPTEKLIIIAAQTAALSAADPRIGTAYSNDQIQLLLSMAWVDSQWGTAPGSNPILSGSAGMIAAQAAIQAGLSPDGTNFVDALAISHAESSWNPVIGNCNGASPNDITYVPSGTNAAWNACTTAVTGNSGSPESLDVGIWQINTPTDSGYNGWSRDELTDPLTNAHAMMAKSGNGSNWGPWCTAWSGGSCSKGTLLGCPGSSYCAYIALAKQIQGQVASVGLGGSYTGIILATKAEWQTLMVPSSLDPNSPANAIQVFAAVNTKIGQVSGGDPTQWVPTLDDWYMMPTLGPVTSAVTAHVQLIIQVDQMGYGGTTGLNEKVLAIAKAQVGGPCSRYAPPKWCPDTGKSEWCAYFVSWVFKAAGVNMPTESLAGSMQSWAQASSIFTQTPEPGDAAVWSTGSGPIAHTDIVVAVQGSGASLEIQTIDGNANPYVVDPPTVWFSPLQSVNPQWYAVGYAVP